METLKKMIAEERRRVFELQEEYKNLKKLPIPHSENDCLTALNCEYLKLKAEVQVLEEDQLQTLPICTPLLLAWTHEILREDVTKLEDLLEFQEDMKRITSEKYLELKKLCSKEMITCDPDEEPLTYNELLEKDRKKPEILRYLHRKLIRRLRRLITNYYSDTVTKTEIVDPNDKKANRKRSLLSILKKLLIEFEDKAAKPEDWEASCPIVEVKGKSSLEKNVEMLLKHQIVEVAEANPMRIKLITN